MTVRIVVVDDEAERFGALHIVEEIIDVERTRGIDTEFRACDFENLPLRLHHALLVGIDSIAEERVKEIIFLKDMIVVDAADIREEIERGCGMKQASPFDHRRVDFKNPTPDIHELILGAIVGKGLPNCLDKISAVNTTCFMIHAQRMQIILGGRGTLACVFENFLFRHRVVKGEEHIANIKDDGVDLHEGEAE